MRTLRTAHFIFDSEKGGLVSFFFLFSGLAVWMVVYSLILSVMLTILTRAWSGDWDVVRGRWKSGWVMADPCIKISIGCSANSQST